MAVNFGTCRVRPKDWSSKLQVVHNEMVRMVAGAFRTAPCDALTILTRMLPMKHYIDKLHYTSALAALQATQDVPSSAAARPSLARTWPWGSPFGSSHKSFQAG